MLKVSAILDSFRSLKDKTVKITFETNELTPYDLTQLALHAQKFGFLLFKQNEFKNAEIDVLENLNTEFDEAGKTPSQRLRSVLYVWWKQDNKGYKDFRDFYTHYMEAYIDNIKNKLEP